MPLPRATAALDGGEVLGGRGQHLAASVVDDHEVLDPDPEAAGHVDARLDRDGVAAHEGGLGARGQARRLVDLQPDAVAEAVTELVAVAALLDDAAGDAIQLTGVRARADLREGRGLSLLDELVDGARLVVEGAGRKGARAVGAVAVHDAA